MRFFWHGRTAIPKVPKRQNLTAQVAESLRIQLKQWQAGDWKVEYRNLCVRKVELFWCADDEECDKDEDSP